MYSVFPDPKTGKSKAVRVLSKIRDDLTFCDPVLCNGRLYGHLQAPDGPMVHTICVDLLSAAVSSFSILNFEIVCHIFISGFAGAVVCIRRPS